MKAKVAVEADLTNVSNYLEEQGYQIIEFTHSDEIAEDLREVDAIIISGMQENLLGMEDVETTAIMIKASGLSPEEIGDMLEQQL
jgi:galactitol-specific phosphotransferase system IIB component